MKNTRKMLRLDKAWQGDSLKEKLKIKIYDQGNFVNDWEQTAFVKKKEATSEVLQVHKTPCNSYISMIFDI